MNADLLKLIELDKVNQEIARLREEVASLPKRMAAIETKLNVAKSQVEAANTAIKAQDVNKRKLESDIQDWQQKISKFREQSLSVKTNDQYRALMHEIEFAEKQIGESEEKILIGMESVEALTRNLKDAQAELAADAKEVEIEKEHARSVTAADEKRLADLNTQQKALRSTLDGTMLAHYERVAAKRKGAISEAFDQKCMACNVMMRPQKYNELLSHSELVTCDSCGRILYHDPSRQPVPGRGVKAGARGGERAWLYIVDENEIGRFVAFANTKGGCSMRAYDAATGQLLEKDVRKKATFQEEFTQLMGSGTGLRSDHLEPDADSADQLSLETLEELQLQARIAPAAKVPATQ